MGLIVIIIVLVLLFGGGGGYYGYRQWGYGGGGGIGTRYDSGDPACLVSVGILPIEHGAAITACFQGASP